MTDTLDAYPSLKQLPDESPAAYQAFIDYIGMGWDRSLSGLADRYREDTKAQHAIPTKQRTTLAKWSLRFKWQERLGHYREDAAAIAIAQQRDYLDENVAWQLKMHRKLREQIESMVERFDELKIAKKTRVPDPRNPDQEIEIVYQRVNTIDLERLVKTYSELGEKLRKQLGLPEQVRVEDWRSDAIRDIRDGRIAFEPLALQVGHDLATELFTLAGVPLLSSGDESAG